MNQHSQQHQETAPPSGNRTWEEADIGSGEKSPGQAETDELIRQIPALPENGKAATPG